MPAFSLPIFLVGCLGGVLPDILRIIRNRLDPNLPAYLKSINFWVGLVLLVLLGGATAWILEAASAKDALVYGFASPQIISQLVGSLQVKKERVQLGGGPTSKEKQAWWAL